MYFRANSGDCLIQNHEPNRFWETSRDSYIKVAMYEIRSTIVLSWDIEGLVSCIFQ